MGTGFGRTDSCSNPRNTLGRGMEPNHPELGLDPNVARRVNRVQTPKKKTLFLHKKNKKLHVLLHNNYNKRVLFMRYIIFIYYVYFVTEIMHKFVGSVH